MPDLPETPTKVVVARCGPGWAAASGLRTALGHRVTGLAVAVAGVLAVLSACALPIDIATDGDDDATTSRAEGTPAPAGASPTEDYSIVSGQPIVTPCWSYDGPQTFVSNISSHDESVCVGALELWGEVQDGTVVPTGVGVVHGQVKIEPVRVSTSDAWNIGTDVAAAVDVLADSYLAENGEIVSLHEEVTLDGVPANITRVEGTSELTQTKVFLTAFAPRVYASGPDEVQFFVIAIVSPYDNGDELVDQVVRTWTWA